MPAGSPIAVNVQSRFGAVPVLAVIRRAIRAAAQAEGVAAGLSVSVLLTGDEEIRELNRRYAGDDRATDVLSFATGPVPGEPGEGGELGDIVLSLDHLRAQAATAGQSLGRESAVLAIHGFLHLLGYDHIEPEEERRMFARTDGIVAAMRGLDG